MSFEDDKMERINLLRKLPVRQGVYTLVNQTNAMIYIGKTKDFIRRWKDHRKRMNRGDHDCSSLQDDFNIGHCFFMEVLEGVEDSSDLYSAEVFWIRKLSTTQSVYNIKHICKNKVYDTGRTISRGNRAIGGWGAEVRKLRVKRGMRQSDLAKELGVSEKTIGRIERNEGKVDPALLEKALLFFT